SPAEQPGGGPNGGDTTLAVDGAQPGGTQPGGARSGGHLGSAGVAVVRCDERWPTGEGELAESNNPLAALEPVGVGGVLDGAFDLLRARFGLLVGLAAAMLLPLQLIEVLGEISSGLDADVDAAGFTSSLDLLAADTATSALGWLVLIMRVIVLSFLGLVMGVMVSDLLDDRRRSAASLVGAAARRWWVAVLVPVLCLPIKIAGGCLLLVGFFIADAFLMCASVVAGAESRGPLHAFGRSWQLATRQFGVALGVSFGGFAILLVLQLAFWIGPALLASQFLASEALLLLVQQIGLLSMLVLQPLTACIAARAYVELRCRTEALDLEIRRNKVGLA
ncbi:MAG: hypothetical protein ACR2OH_07475, partial [Microthrixaceae bacterium]